MTRNGTKMVQKLFIKNLIKICLFFNQIFRLKIEGKFWLSIVYWLMNHNTFQLWILFTIHMNLIKYFLNISIPIKHLSSSPISQTCSIRILCKKLKHSTLNMTPKENLNLTHFMWQNWSLNNKMLKKIIFRTTYKIRLFLNNGNIFNLHKSMCLNFPKNTFSINSSLKHNSLFIFRIRNSLNFSINRIVMYFHMIFTNVIN